MRVTNIVKSQVRAAIKACIVTANARFGRTFKYPTVVYKKRGTTAGTACDRTYTIDLNSVLLMENIEHFLATTVPHEFAHLVDGIVNPHTRRRGYGKRSLHGPTWQNIMWLFGVDPNRCHSYDTTNSAVKKKGQVKHVWTCSCGNGTMKIGKIRHNKMIADDSVRYWMRGHKNHTYTYAGIEGAAPAPVLKAASAAKPKPGPKRTTRVTKLDTCRNLYRSGSSRYDMIVAFMGAGCTLAGAGTYYAKIKKERS